MGCIANILFGRLDRKHLHYLSSDKVSNNVICLLKTARKKKLQSEIIRGTPGQQTHSWMIHSLCLSFLLFEIFHVIII